MGFSIPGMVLLDVEQRNGGFGDAVFGHQWGVDFKVISLAEEISHSLYDIDAGSIQFPGHT